MRIVLEIIEGVGVGRKKALRAPMMLTVGRGESADWMVSEDSVMSSKHFQVTVNHEGCFVTDLESTNGTTVDGQRMTRQMLVDGNKIKAGATVFQISMTQRERTSTLMTGHGSPPAETNTKTQRDQLSNKPASHDTPQPKPIPVDEVLRQTATLDTSQRDPSAAARATKPLTVGERAVDYQLDRSRSRPFTGAVIKIVSEVSQGRKSILRTGQSVTVGRTEESDFAIADPQLSAKHFTLANARSGWQLTDLNSTAGTTVNGTRISSSLVKTGDRIVAGQTHFVVTIGESAPMAASGDDSAYPFQEGVRDEDPRVRRAAFQAAAWSAEPWLLDHCRECAKEASPEKMDALLMLSILGLPSDLDLIRRLGRQTDLGPNRFELLGSFAHPAVVPDLLDAIKDEDPKTAVVAGVTFSRITGLDIASDRRVELPPEDGGDQDEADEDFAEDAIMPDAAKAEREWQKLEPQFASGTRFRLGVNTSVPPTQDLLIQLDMRSRWEECLRGKFEGTWNGNPFDLERFSFHELLQIQS